MSTGYFTDKNHPPTPEELQAALGEAYPLWERLASFIHVTYDWSEAMTYGGKNYGWNLWVRLQNNRGKSGKPLVSLFPAEGRIIAQVVLGKEQVERALQLPLGEKTSRMVRETPQLHDGKWLFLPVQDERDALDIEQLMLLKRRPVKRRDTDG
jgi:hypothetical protein